MDSLSDLPRMIALLKKLVECESPSHDKTAVDRLAGIVAAECRLLGARVEMLAREKAGDLVLAHLGRGPGGILLLCHMDTVFPLGTLSRFPFRQDGGLLHGPGVADMKGGIVVALAAMQALAHLDKVPHPVSALFTSDEEVGSAASRGVIEDLSRQSALVLVLEPGMPDGSVKTWRKGVGEFNVKVHGRAAHAGGDHEKGRNAIEELAHQVLVIQAMTDYERGTTLNAGVIRGGSASNVVPDEASLEVDLRVMQPGEAERITARMLALKPVLEGTTLQVTGGLNRPPMPFNDLNRNAYEQLCRIAARHGQVLQAAGTGGASDANFVAALGIPVLDGLGPAGGDYHSEREYLVTASLAERVTLLTAVLQEWETE